MTAIALPVCGWMGFPQYCGERSYRQTTAASVVYQGQQETPTGVFELPQAIDLSHHDSLDWMSLSRAVLRESVALTAEERASVNDFFWSHFE